MKKTSIIIVIFITIISFKSFAQQVPLYSQYMFNKMLINPAVTGSENDLPIQLLVRQQWIGIENAPSTQILNGQYRFDNYNMGVGAVLFVDRFGHEQKIGFQANYSYILQAYEGAKIALGIGIQVFQYQFNYSQLIAVDDYDPNILNNEQSKIVPEADFGAYLYHDNYFVGISANQLLGLPIKIKEQEIPITRLVQHYNLIGGYKFTLNNEFQLEPSILFKTTFKSPSQLDINVRGIYLENYWIGLSYRTDGDIISLLGLAYKEFEFGIAADFATSNIAAYQHGSYELMLKYKIPISPKNKGASKF